MPSLKDLKVRIKSVKSTQKITKAMKVVAASKLRRSREAAEASRPYAVAMERMVARLAEGCKGQSNVPKLLAGTGKNNKHLLIIATSDRGLCGAFNGSIVRAARKQIRGLLAEGKTVKIYTVGRKAQALLSGEFKQLMVGNIADIARKTVQFASAEKVAAEVFEIIEMENIDVVSIVYNHFKSAISQVVTWQQLMPLAVANGDAHSVVPSPLRGGLGRGETNSSQPTSSPPPQPSPQGGGSSPVAPSVPKSASYEFEPSQEEILTDLLPRNFTMQLFKALLESAASEQGARMNAMENATKNAGEMIKKLSLKYNRTRQANITKELIEIISGAEAI